MKSAIEVKKDEVNSFGDRVRVFEYKNLETKEVIFTHTFFHHEGQHTTFLFDLRMFQLLIEKVVK